MYRKRMEKKAAVCLLPLLFIFGCKFPIATVGNYGTVIFKIGEVQLTRSGSESKEINIKDAIYSGDVLTTGEKSMVTVQFGETCLLRLDQKTSCKAMKIDTTTIDVFLYVGSAST